MTGTSTLEELREPFSEFIETRLGLHFPSNRWPDLERGLRTTAAELGFDDPADCAQSFLSGKITLPECDALAAHLTVGETYFFRDPEAFAALERDVLPPLIAARRATTKQLRIWSAACATGEEAYSIAIAVRRALPDIADWHVTILATDVNPRFLAKAVTGVYRQWSFRSTPDPRASGEVRELPDGHFEVLPELRKLVTFSCLNLVEDTYPSLANHTTAMDVIFCRNLMIYFSAETARRVAAKLHRSLLDGGWLFTSAAEASPDIFVNFQPGNLSTIVAMQKRSAATLERSSEDASSARLLEEKISPPAGLQTPPVAAAAADAPPFSPAELARRLGNEGRFDEALHACEEAIAVNRLDPEAHYLRGLFLAEQGASDDAASAFRRALFLDPEFVMAHFASGTLLQQLGRSRDADRAFENVRMLLRDLPLDAVLVAADGMTVSRLLELVTFRPETTP